MIFYILLHYINNSHLFVALFQPGNGALLWLSDSVSDTKLMRNLDTFKYTTHSSFTSQSGSIRASFLPPEDGSYSFPSSCYGSAYGLELINLTRSTIHVKRYAFKFIFRVFLTVPKLFFAKEIVSMFVLYFA